MVGPVRVPLSGSKGQARHNKVTPCDVESVRDRYSDNEIFFEDPRLVAADPDDVPGSRCCSHCCEMAWCAMVLLCLKMFFLFLPSFCCECASEKYDGAKKTLRLAGLGLPGFPSMMLMLQGMDTLQDGVTDVSDEHFHVPSDDLPKPNRRKAEYMSGILGEDVWVCDGDYDTPGHVNKLSSLYRCLFPCVRSCSGWHSGTTTNFWGSKDVEKGKREWYATLVSVLGRGGGGAKSRTDLIDPNTADGIARFCTQGFAANFLTKQQNGGYVVDMRYMEPMRVRPGYR